MRNGSCTAVVDGTEVVDGKSEWMEVREREDSGRFTVQTVWNVACGEDGDRWVFMHIHNLCIFLTKYMDRCQYNQR